MRLAARKTMLAAVVVGAVFSPAARAQTVPAPADATAPIVVGDQRVSKADIAALMRGGELDEHAAAVGIIRDAWMRREAAARGLTADPAKLDAVLAEDQREQTDGSGDTYEAALARSGLSVDQRRAELVAGLIEEAVDDVLLREAHGDPAAYGRSWRALEARERAVTSCTAAAAPGWRNWCANRRPTAAACTITGLDEVCRFPATDGEPVSWGASPDLILAFMDPPKAVDAAIDPDAERGLARLLRYLRTHEPAAARDCEFDPDDLAYYSCSRRAYAIDVLYAVARIHAAAKAEWTVPATAGWLG